MIAIDPPVGFLNLALASKGPSTHDPGAIPATAGPALRGTIPQPVPPGMAGSAMTSRARATGQAFPAKVVPGRAGGLLRKQERGLGRCRVVSGGFGSRHRVLVVSVRAGG